MLKDKILYHIHGYNEGSIAHRCRLKRMREFEEIFAGMFSEEISAGRKVKVLDVGGTWSFWKVLHFKYLGNINLTLMNLKKPEIPEGITNVKGTAGNATNLAEYSDKEFDLVFSNSVIEHVGHEPEQQKMANEMQRVGKHYYLQTPNKFFPIEPHFLFPPYIQLLPLRAKIFLFQHFNVGWRYKKVASYDEARRIADSVDLLTKKRLQKFFPDAEIKSEKFCGLTKSFYLFA